VHPAGIKFGLSEGLLQLRGADVVVSDQLFEALSAEARRRIKLGRRVDGYLIWDHVVNRGLCRVFQQTSAPRQEVVPFFMALDRVIRESLMPLADRAQIGRKIGRDFIAQAAFDDEFRNRIVRLDFAHDVAQARRLLFRECCDTVRALCAQHDPENTPHADLLALFMFNFLHTTGSIEIIARLRTARPRAQGSNGGR
jgi:hypothetical protein